MNPDSKNTEDNEDPAAASDELEEKLFEAASVAVSSVDTAAAAAAAAAPTATASSVTSSSSSMVPPPPPPPPSDDPNGSSSVPKQEPPDGVVVASLVAASSVFHDVVARTHAATAAIAAATSSSIQIVPPGEMERLLRETNFTDTEIIQFYQLTLKDGGTAAGGITKVQFGVTCLQHGITSSRLMERLWTVFDTSGDGILQPYELVVHLNPLLRGTREQVAALFFDLYDLNGNGDLTAAEISAVYSDMIVPSKEEALGLSTAQKQRLTQWVHDNRSPDGTLDKETFVQAVLQMDNADDKDDTPKTQLWSGRTMYYWFWITWFEMGTSFSLPAMGALSSRIKERFDIGDSEIGTLTSVYFVAAMVGPLVGGLCMDRYGPLPVIIGANIIVTVGAACQAAASNPDQFWLIVLGRLLLGFGGEMTPFTTVETLGRLFPDYFGLMAGIRNLVQSVSTFLAFVLLPLWADATDSTSFALWMCAILSVVSTVSSAVVFVSVQRTTAAAMAAAAEEQSDQRTITKQVRAFAQAMAPRLKGCSKWRLPLSFYFSIYGIKSQYFAPLAFTAFSNAIYVNKFGQSTGLASFMSGGISLVAGLLGPVMGMLSDAKGYRSPSLVAMCLLSSIGFIILAVSNTGDAPVWIASALFAIQYGFGDTVAYISIRFIVGVSRAGIGYGIYGIVGNAISAVVPIVGGILMEQDDDNYTKTLWYFAGLMAFGAVCWFMVFVLEGKNSLLELPADKVIETSDKDIRLAALTHVVGEQEKKKIDSDTVSKQNPVVF